VQSPAGIKREKTIESDDRPSLNPYAPPDARLDDAEVQQSPASGFFAVGLVKLALMSVATVNLYGLYWFYQQWKAASRVSGDKLNAPVRAFFAGLTSYFLFKRIEGFGAQHGVQLLLGPGQLGLYYFLLGALCRLPDPYWLIPYFFLFLPLLPVQSAVNRINQELAPGSYRNGGLSGWNIFAVALGVLLWSLMLAGVFMTKSGSD
jgi:hypothetical protein